MTVFLSTLVFLGVMLLRHSGSLEHLELAAYDQCVRLRTDAVASSRDIVLVGVTEEDIRNLGRWPLPDTTLARLLEVILQSRPRAVGLDIFRDISVPPGTDQLNDVLRAQREIVAVMKFGGGRMRNIPPPVVLRDTDQVGFSDIVEDDDGIVRRGLLFLDDGGKTAYSFALRLALRQLAPDGIMPQPDVSHPEYLRLGRTTFQPFESNDGGYVRADARGYQFLLDSREHPSSFPFLTLTTVLHSAFDPAMMRDAVVLVGVTAESVKDYFYTPLSGGWHGDGPISGIALHAQTVAQLLNAARRGQSPIRTASKWEEGLWIFVWSLLGGTIGFRARTAWRFTFAVTGGVLVLGLAATVVFLCGWWIPVVPPALTWFTAAAVAIAYRSNRERAERALLMQLFSRHVSRDVADAIWRERDQFMEQGRPRPQRLTATVLFTDLQGFTSVSEKLSPSALMDWLNEYMERMAQLVIRHRGVIDKYIGDSIMAVFGVPVARSTTVEIDRDAVNAVDCALAMERAMVELNATWAARALPTIGMRVGIFSGPLVAGSLGSAERLEYTVIGDTVNTASRLESFGKESTDANLVANPCRILIGETTLAHLDQQFVTTEVGATMLKGKSEPVRVYRVLGRQERTTSEASFGGTAEIGRAKAGRRETLIAALALAIASCACAAQGYAQAADVKNTDLEPTKAASDVPIYRPPKRGAPGRTVGAGSRGREALGNAQPVLSVLAPDHLGLTVHDQPPLFWYISEATTARVDLTLTDYRETGHPVTVTLPAVTSPGIQSIRLGDHNLHLELGVPYEWTVTVIPDPHRRTQDISASGGIERIQAPADLAAKLSRSAQSVTSFTYAELGIWYDALAALSGAIAAAPNDPVSHLQRAALLEQVGLGDIAGEERKHAGD